MKLNTYDQHMDSANAVIAMYRTFNLQLTLVGVTLGRTTAIYEFKLADGLNLDSLHRFDRNLQAVLKTDGFTLQTPIPGRDTVGITLPLTDRAAVDLGPLLNSPEFNDPSLKVPVILGVGVNDRPIVADLHAMPHLLVSGATGSGKSIFLHSLIYSLGYLKDPSTVSMVVIDPKRVELGRYVGFCPNVKFGATSIDSVVKALRWLQAEMEVRYDLMQEAGVRTYDQFTGCPSKPDFRFCSIVVVIDELADVLLSSKESRDLLNKLLAMSRAAGLFFVIATQRPSVNVIDGTMKANVPARIAFRVATATDSRVILDEGGAERLTGKGDMLFKGTDGNLQRIQGAYVAV